MSPEKVEPDADNLSDDNSHSHFRSSLRIWHPMADPGGITEATGLEPRRAWKAGEPRQTPAGEPLQRTYSRTGWTVGVLAGRYPERDLNKGIRESSTGSSGAATFSTRSDRKEGLRSCSLDGSLSVRAETF